MNRTQARKRLEELLAWKRGALVDGRCSKCEAIGEVSEQLKHQTLVSQLTGLPARCLVFPHAADCPLADTRAVTAELNRLCQRFGFQLQNVLEGTVNVGSEVAEVYSIGLVDDDGR